MSYIKKAYLKNLIILGALSLFISLSLTNVLKIFFYNITLNTIILGVIGFGIGLSFYKLIMLSKEAEWLETYDEGVESFPGAPEPKILAPLSLILKDKKNNAGYVSPITAKSILSSIEGRLDDSQSTSRYVVGLLIFLGLIGTFWGLSTTISAVASVISNLDMTGQVKDAFLTLKQGLYSPLSGMGMAFSSSLFGLVGSLIVGFLDLQYSRACNAFYHKLEERLAIATRVTKTTEGAGLNAANQAGPHYTQSLLEQTAENLSALHNVLQKNEESRLRTSKAFGEFGEKLSKLSDQMVVSQKHIESLTKSQLVFQDMMSKIIKTLPDNDEALKRHLRNMDATTQKILEETIHGRSQTATMLQNEIRLISKTLSSLAQNDVAA